MPDKIKLLYDAASKKYNLGTFDEFANKLQDESKRKAFFDVASNDFDLGDFNSFTDKVKKKVDSQPASVAAATGGYGSQLGSQTFQPTSSIEEVRSQNIADKFKVPNTQLPKSKLGFKQPEVKTTQLEIAPQTKVYRDFNAPTIQQEFGVATPEVKSNIGESITKQGGFQSDILNNIQKIGEVNKAKPKPTNLGILDTISEYLYLPSIGQGFSDVVVKPLAGATDFLDRTIDKAYTTITGEKTPDWLRKGGGFDAGVKFYEDQYNNRVKPTNLVSEIAEGTLGTLPLIAALATGQGEASALSKAPQLVSSLTKYFTVKGALNSYKDATDEKLGYIESLNKASKGGLQGFKEGLELDATMLVGGALGKGVAQQLLNKGLLIGGKSTDAVLHALAVGTTFAGTSAGDDLLNGRDINTREALKQFGTGLAFELIPTSQKINADLKDRKNANDINDAAVKSAAVAKSASNLNSESAVRSLLQLTPEQVKSVNDNIKQSKDELYASSIEAGAKAYEESDPNKKRDLLINQLGLKSQGDIKLISEKLGQNYNEVKASIENSTELTPEEKADLVAKIDILAPKEAKGQPLSEVDNFVDRIKKGEQLRFSEDLQFYENNKQEIETKLKNNAVQEQSTAGEVPPATEGGQVVTEGGEGVGQSIQGTEAPQEIKPEEKVKPELIDVKSTSDFIRSNDLARDIAQRADQFFVAKEGKDINDTISEEYHRAKLDGSNPALVKAVEESVPEVAVQETVVEAPQKGLRTVKLEVNEDLANNGIGLRAVEMPDGKFGIFKEVDGKVTGKSLGRSFETVEELQSAYDGGIKDALTAEAIRKAEASAPQETVTAEVIQPASAEQARLHNEESGSTFTVDGVNRNGTKAASVSIFPERTKIVEGELTKEDIDGYVKENSDIYAGNGDVLAVGTWLDGKTGKTYLDVSVVLPKKEARRLGKDYNQISVWDLEKGKEIPTGGTGEAIEGLKPEIDRVSDIRNILGQQKGLKQAEVKPAEKPVTDSLQRAKDKLAAAKAKLDASRNNMGIAQDPKQRAKDLFDYHSSLVDVAKEYIKYGVKNVKDFAKELGEDVGGSIKAAWDEANGLSKKGMKDFMDATEAELIGITKKDIENLRENMGEEQFEYETQTREKLVERASKKIEDGANVPELIEKINNGTKKTIEDVDVEMIRQYYASLTAAINEAPTPELLAQRKALLDALDKAKVSAGRAVQAFDGLIAVEDNLSKFLADESKFADLTPEEITELTAKYERMQQVHKELEDRYAKLESEAAEKEAKDRIAAIRASERKAKVAAKKMDFKDERKVYVDEFRKRLREIRSGASATIFPYQRELVELAPFVAKMVKSYVSEGIFDLKTIVEGVHEQFKNDIEGLSQEDIRDIIAGKYVDTKQTKNAKLAQIRDLKSQARIEAEIENLKNGLEKETKPVEKRKKSDRLVELEKELKEIKRRTREENAPSPLDKKKTYYQNKIDKLKAELASGDFAEVKEPAKITLDSEGLKLQDEYNKLVNETRERRDAKERETMSKVDKALEIVEQVTGLKRLVQTALDLSIPLRQGVAVMLNPRTAKIGGEAYVKMIKSVFNIDGKGLAKFKFDDKFYNRMMSEIERSPNYLESKADGIVYTELGSKSGEKRDESHPSESFVYKIPYLSAPFRASERAAAGWTNSARYELYNRGVKQLLAEGKTRENSPKAYEDMAARVMVDTGRGKIPGISDKTPDATGKKIKWALGKTMYGARLFAASIRKLNPLYYLNPKVDKTIRVEAFKDMIGYTTSQILFHVAIASAIGATVSLDPDDSDFLKLRLGKKVIDLSAGQSAYIRTFLRLVKAVYLQSDPEVSKEDADKYSKFAASSVGTFFRNKLAPNTSYAVNAFMGSNSIGEKFDPYEVIKLYPMYTEDLLTAFNDGSMLDAAVILPLAISGLGYQEYSKNVRQAKLSNYLDTKDSDLKQFLNKNKLTISSDINQEIYNPTNGNLEAMDKKQSDKFESAWAEYVMQEVRDNIPAIEAMKADIFSKNPSSVTKLKLQEFSRKSENKDLTDAELKDKFYQNELKKKISTIKTEGNDYAKEVVIGFPKDLLKVEVNINGKNIPHSLTKQEVDKRVAAYNKYLKENKETFILNYNQYISDGETPANAKKYATRDLKLDAVNASGDEILDTYYDETTGEYKF